MTRKTVTTNQAKALLEGRGINAPYQTLVRWVRDGRFKGARLEPTERGPVWRIPLQSVHAFKPPTPGRPRKQPAQPLKSAA
jgi:hypothetical protein